MCSSTTSIFIILVLVFSWGVWIPLVNGTIHPHSSIGILLTVLGGFGPAIAAVLTLTLHGGSPGTWFRSLLRWRVQIRWYAIAILLPPAVILLAALSHSLLTTTPLRLSTNVSLIHYPLSIVGIAIIGGGQEEFGWRGYLLPTLREHLGPATASVVIGILWTVWHAHLVTIAVTYKSQLPVGV